MPHVKSPYDKLKKSELKALLLQRDQSTTAPQSSLTVHATSSDNAHPVSQDNGLGFLGFPGEIRNEIYKLVADYTIQKDDSRACTFVYSYGDWDWEKDRRLTRCHNPQLVILQPGLFLTCRQTRIEGLPFFYRRRDFHLPLNHGKRILDLYWDQAGFSLWLQAIGDLGQQNIRHLTLRNGPMMRGIDFIERIHRKLNDEATVVYKSNSIFFVQALRNIETRYQAKNEEKVPSFWCEPRNWPRKWPRNWQGRHQEIFRLSNSSLLPSLELVEQYSLKSEAGFGWFGMAQDDKAQLWWRRDKRIEKWNQEWLAIDEESRPDMSMERYNGLRRWRRAKAATVVEGDSLVEGHQLEDSELQVSESDNVDGDSQMGGH